MHAKYSGSIFLSKIFVIYQRPIINACKPVVYVNLNLETIRKISQKVALLGRKASVLELKLYATLHASFCNSVIKLVCE